MNEPRIIALYGPKRSGKDTVADLLKQRGYSPVAFATPVRAAVAAAYGLPYLDFMDLSSDGATKEVPCPELFGRDPRTALVDMGCHFRDQVDQLHWAKVLKRRVDADPHKRFIVTDCRFLNEADFVREQLGGVVLGVFRPETWDPGEHNDRAEAAVYDSWNRAVDAVVVNNGDLDDLRHLVKRMGLPTFAPGTKVAARWNRYTTLKVEAPMDDEFNVRCRERRSSTVSWLGNYCRTNLVAKPFLHVAESADMSFRELLPRA